MMFPRTIKNSLTKKVLSVSLIGCITVTITAAGMQPFLVYASVGSGTLRGLLIGASAMLGTGNINPTSVSYLNTNTVLNSSIESIYDGTVTVADINSALSGEIGTARWTAPLANNAQQVTMAQEYVSAAGGDPSSLNGLGAASVGENIKAIADYYYEHGELKPAFGGQTMTDNIMGAAVMQSMADVAYNFDNVMWYARENGWTDEQIDALFDSGAAFGDLQNAIDYIENLDKTIVKGEGVNTSDNILKNLTPNANFAYFQGGSGSYYNYIIEDGLFPYYYGTSTKTVRITNFSSSNKTIYKNEGVGAMGNMTGSSSYSIQPNQTAVSYTTTRDNIFGFNLLPSNINGNDNSAVKSYYLSNFSEDEEKKSPDIITNNGQAEGTWTQDPNQNNRNQFNINVTVNFDPNYNYTIPDETTINNYIQDTIDAINNGDNQEDIGQYIKDLIEEMKHSIPQPTEAPFPTMSPSTIPVQPTEAPKPTNTLEQEQQNTTGMATPELAEKFPFCIPFDIFTMMSHFTANRSAPYINAELNLGPAGVHYIEIDMSEFDDVAAVLRTLQLILFIVGLALVARRLIGAGGD